MERGDGNWGRESVMSELHQGMKLAKRLKKQLQHSNSSSCGFLIQEIVSCYDNALALLNHMDSLQTTLLHFKPTIHQVSDQEFKDHVVADLPKKRKSLSRRSEEVHEDEHGDGYNWRKYGQKHILGATHPRSYYRCTHRRTQGCLAMKQVQRGEDDSRILKVVYRGNHSCVVKQKNENVGTDDVPQQSSKPIPEPYLSPSQSQSHKLDNFKIEDNFLNTDLFPLEDLDFMMDVDFDGRFVEVCHYFSYLQDSPLNKK